MKQRVLFVNQNLLQQQGRLGQDRTGFIISFVFFPVKGRECNKNASLMYVCADVFMGQAEEEETHGRR